MSQPPKTPMHFCSYCLKIVSGDQQTHLRVHGPDVKASIYWAALRGLDEVPRPQVTEETENVWVSTVQSIEQARQTRDETERKQRGIEFMASLFDGLVVCIPFGSSVIGTGWSGSSDTDLSVRVTSKLVYLELAEFHPRDYASIASARLRIQEERGTFISLNNEGGISAGVVAYSIEAAWATWRAMKQELQKSHPRGGATCNPSIRDAPEVAIISFLVYQLSRMLYDCGGRGVNSSNISSLISVSVPIIRLDFARDTPTCEEALVFEDPSHIEPFILESPIFPVDETLTDANSAELYFSEAVSPSVVKALVDVFAGVLHAAGHPVQPLRIVEKEGPILKGGLGVRLGVAFASVSAVQVVRRQMGGLACTVQGFTMARGRILLGVRFAKAGQAVAALLQYHARRRERGGARLSVFLTLPSSLLGKWDITARPQFGPRNSVLVKTMLSEAGEPATVACCMVKRWASIHNLSDTRAGYLSSYAFVLMFCFYLQQVGAIGYLDHTSVEPHADIASCPVPTKLDKAGCARARDLALGFFDFYHHYDWNRVVTFKGKATVVMEDLKYTHEESFKTMGGMRRNHKHAWVGIEDPYEDVNTARRVSYARFQYLTGMLAATHLALAEADPKRLHAKIQLLFSTGLGGPQDGAADGLLSEAQLRALREAQSAPRMFRWEDAYVPPIGTVDRVRQVAENERVVPDVPMEVQVGRNDVESVGAAWKLHAMPSAVPVQGGGAVYRGPVTAQREGGAVGQGQGQAPVLRQGYAPAEGQGGQHPQQRPLQQQQVPPQYQYQQQQQQPVPQQFVQQRPPTTQQPQQHLQLSQQPAVQQQQPMHISQQQPQQQQQQPVQVQQQHAIPHPQQQQQQQQPQQQQQQHAVPQQQHMQLAQQQPSVQQHQQQPVRVTQPQSPIHVQQQQQQQPPVHVQQQLQHAPQHIQHQKLQQGSQLPQQQSQQHYHPQMQPQSQGQHYQGQQSAQQPQPGFHQQQHQVQVQQQHVPHPQQQQQQQQHTQQQPQTLQYQQHHLQQMPQQTVQQQQPQDQPQPQMVPQPQEGQLQQQPPPQQQQQQPQQQQHQQQQPQHQQPPQQHHHHHQLQLQPIHNVHHQQDPHQLQQSPVNFPHTPTGSPHTQDQALSAFHPAAQYQQPQYQQQQQQQQAQFPQSPQTPLTPHTPHTPGSQQHMPQQGSPMSQGDQYALPASKYLPTGYVEEADPPMYFMLKQGSDQVGQQQQPQQQPQQLQQQQQPPQQLQQQPPQQQQQQQPQQLQMQMQQMQVRRDPYESEEEVPV